MQKIHKVTEINETVIYGWKTSCVEKILSSPHFEENLLLAFENGLYDTPAHPKINPREMIYALTIQKNISSFTLKEVKTITRNWIEMKSSTSTDNILPFYYIELDYILSEF
ncbi:MAG: hypothetical protein H6622_10490 [Halobacteriovoraceae bacterium]|nr:hypothetical protein [Halobacteriovoraceae bacterium]